MESRRIGNSTMHPNSRDQRCPGKKNRGTHSSSREYPVIKCLPSEFKGSRTHKARDACTRSRNYRVFAVYHDSLKTCRWLEMSLSMTPGIPNAHRQT